MGNKVFKKVVTHSTIFHSDDIFGVAMWKLINPNIEVIRTLDPSPWKDDPEAIVFDIGAEFGMLAYDHHQKEGKQLRPVSDGVWKVKVMKNGQEIEEEQAIPYCGFGLLWRDFGYLLCDEKEAWKRVDQTFVLPIDKADNGVSHNMLSSTFSTFNPNWDSEEDENECFNKAVETAMVILKSVIDSANAAVRAYDYILSCFDQNSQILILDKWVPYESFIIKEPRTKDICFVVYPHKRGGYAVQTVKKVLGAYTNRMDFPTEWLGHPDPERGIHFAHTSNFLICCDTKEQAIAVAEEALEAGMNAYSNVYSI